MFVTLLKFKMKAHVIGIIFILLIGSGISKKTRRDDLLSEISEAKQRLRSDFLEKLWVSISETIATSQYNILKLYTASTIEQAQQIVEYLAQRSNITRSESENTLKKALEKKNFTSVDCIIKNEISTIQAYKTTGYNLHTCIRMAQINTESQHLEIMKKFETIKLSCLRQYEYYNRHVENCVDTDCVLKSLIQSVIQVEKLREELAGNVTEINNLSSRYMMTNIAMGCVASAINQVYDNYNIGKGLVDGCLNSTSNTIPNNKPN